MLALPQIFVYAQSMANVLNHWEEDIFLACIALCIALMVVNVVEFRASIISCLFISLMILMVTYILISQVVYAMILYETLLLFITYES